MNETGNTAYISAETEPPARSHPQGGADTIDQVAAAINFALAAVEHDCLVSELTTGEIKELAHAAIAAMSGWQPIETAPKDGAWILIFENDAKPLDTVMWNDFYETWRNGYNDHPSYPTHWQPLPAPPEVKP